jgi:hypothetical protein
MRNGLPQESCLRFTLMRQILRAFSEEEATSVPDYTASYPMKE